jgi:hypothetical protein
MKNFSRYASLVWAPAWAAFAQTPDPVASTRIEWPKSAVTVVFAPDLNQAALRQNSSTSDALESWIQKAMIDGPAKNTPKRVEFAAPRGATGIRVGPESMLGTVVVVDEEGKRHSTCAPLSDAIERLRTASHSRRKEIGSDK